MKNRKEGQMSNEWKMVRLGDVCTKASSNISLNKVAGDLGEYPLFGASGFAKNIDFYHQEKEYIAIVKDGAGVGRVMMLPSKSSIVGTMQYLLPKSNIRINYLCYILKQLDLAKYASGATIPHIYFKDYSKEDVFLPPIAKQREIAEVLDKASELVEKRKAQLAELDILAESVFYDMFGDPVTNPKGWDIQLLGNICTKITDGKHGGCTIEDNAGYFFIGAREINYGVVNYSNAPQISQVEFEKDYKRCNAEIGDLVIVNTGATIGKSAILNSSYTTKTLLQKSVALIKTDISKILPVFLQFCYRLNENMYRVYNASAQPNLLLSNMRITEVILPLLHLQQQFAERIEKIEEQKAKAKEALKESENLFQRLMQDMFNPEYHNS